MSVGSRIVFALVAMSLSACTYGEKSFAKFSAKHPSAELLPVAFVKQKEAADCGAAALTSVGQYWGVDVAPGSIYKETAPLNPTFGYSIGELHQVSDRLGLSSARLLEEPDYVFGLVGEGIPVIAPISKPYQRRDIFDWMLSSMLSRLIVSAFVDDPTFNHYVVVVGSNERLVYLLDPQDGYRALDREEFIDQWASLTLKFVPDAGENVAALAPYRALADITPIEVPMASSFVSEIAGFDFDETGLAAGGAGITRAP
jgi:Peptidase C39 family